MHSFLVDWKTKPYISQMLLYLYDGCLFQVNNLVSRLHCNLRTTQALKILYFHVLEKTVNRAVFLL